MLATSGQLYTRQGITCNLHEGSSWFAREAPNLVGMSRFGPGSIAVIPGTVPGLVPGPRDSVLSAGGDIVWLVTADGLLYQREGVSLALPDGRSWKVRKYMSKGYMHFCSYDGGEGKGHSAGCDRGMAEAILLAVMGE